MAQKVIFAEELSSSERYLAVEHLSTELAIHHLLPRVPGTALQVQDCVLLACRGNPLLA